MDLRQLRTFVHIAEFQSFTRAAAFLHVSQPALSRQMRLLEEELGTNLFHRHAHGAQMTHDGALFLDRCKKLLSEFEELRHEFHTRSRTAGATGNVSIGVPVPATRFLDTEFLVGFAERYSGISLRVVEGFSALLHEWLISGSLELAILYGPRQSKVLSCEPIATEDLCAIGPVTAENMARSSITASELVQNTLILPNRPHIIRDLVDDLPIKDLDILEVGAMTLMIELARVGRGYSILPRSAVDRSVAAGEVVALPIHEPNLSWEVSIWYSNLRPLSAASELVLGLVREQLTGMVKTQKWKARLLETQLHRSSFADLTAGKKLAI